MLYVYTCLRIGKVKHPSCANSVNLTDTVHNSNQLLLEAVINYILNNNLETQLRDFLGVKPARTVKLYLI